MTQFREVQRALRAELPGYVRAAFGYHPASLSLLLAGPLPLLAFRDKPTPPNEVYFSNLSRCTPVF